MGDQKSSGELKIIFLITVHVLVNFTIQIFISILFQQTF
jgi:hypothetical protein